MCTKLQNKFQFTNDYEKFRIYEYHEKICVYEYYEKIRVYKNYEMIRIYEYYEKVRNNYDNDTYLRQRNITKKSDQQKVRNMIQNRV